MTELHYRSPRSRIVSNPNTVAVEESPRWIRGYYKNVKLIDSKLVWLLWEGTSLIPFWAFPASDVEGLQENDTVNGGRDGRRGQWFDIKLSDDTVIENVGWKFKPDTIGLLNQAKDLIIVDFQKLDKWLEDDERVIGHPRSPYSRIDVRASSRNVRIELDGIILVETNKALFLYENGHPTRYYINTIDVNPLNLFEPSTYRSACAYKGIASYFSAKINGKIYPNIVWVYYEPADCLTRIQGRWSFWNENVDIFVDGEKIPRPERYIVHTDPGKE